MIQILYTDSDRIRGVLGLDNKDLSDADLGGRALDIELGFSFAGWLSTHATRYTDGTTTGATAAEIEIALAIELYSTYFCATLVVPALQLLARQAISDGKNSLDRFIPIEWSKLMEQLTGRVQFYRSLLENLTGAVAPGIPSSLQLVGVGLAVDPAVTAT